MKRRVFLNTAGMYAFLAAMNYNCSIIKNTRNSSHLVATPERRAQYLAKILKTLCAEFNDGIALWTGNQVLDDAYGKKELKLTDIKYGRAIAEVFPIVLALAQDDQDKLLQQMKVQVLKFRNLDKTFTITVRPNFHFATIDVEASEFKNMGKSLVNW